MKTKQQWFEGLGFTKQEEDIIKGYLEREKIFEDVIDPPEIIRQFKKAIDFRNRLFNGTAEFLVSNTYRIWSINNFDVKSDNLLYWREAWLACRYGIIFNTTIASSDFEIIPKKKRFNWFSRKKKNRVNSTALIHEFNVMNLPTILNAKWEENDLEITNLDELIKKTKKLIEDTENEENI